jgi:hypothetical protein
MLSTHMAVSLLQYTSSVLYFTSIMRTGQATGHDCNNVQTTIPGSGSKLCDSLCVWLDLFLFLPIFLIFLNTKEHILTEMKATMKRSHSGHCIIICIGHGHSTMRDESFYLTRFRQGHEKVARSLTSVETTSHGMTIFFYAVVTQFLHNDRV